MYVFKGSTVLKYLLLCSTIILNLRLQSLVSLNYSVVSNIQQVESIPVSYIAVLENCSNITLSSDIMPQTVKSMKRNLLILTIKYYKRLSNFFQLFQVFTISSTDTKTFRNVIYKSIFVARKVEVVILDSRCHYGRNFQNFRL